jgi:hypothetical protein
MNQLHQRQPLNSISDPKIERLIAAFRIHIKEMTLLGKRDGARKEQLTESEWRITVFNPLEQIGNANVMEVQKVLQPAAHMIGQAQTKIRSEIDAKEINKEIQEDKIAESRCEQEMEVLRPDEKRRVWRKRLWIYAFIISFFDGLLGFNAFRAGKESFLYSFLYGLTIALTILVGAKKFAVMYVMRAKNKTWQYIRIFIVAISAAITFGYLGNLRAANYVQKEGIKYNQSVVSVTSKYAVSGTTVGALGWIFFMASLLFSRYVYMTKEEELLMDEYKTKSKTLCKVQAKIDAAKSAVVKIRDYSEHKTDSAFGICEYAHACRKSIQAIAEQACNAYAAAYISARTDGHCPYFLHTPPPFNFNSFTN